MHRFKKNRPALFNTSADYHTSLKLEADKAQQALADQDKMRKKKKPSESSSTQQTLAPPGSNSKKRKKATGAVLGRPRRETRDGSVKSAVSDSRESSPAVLRAEKRAAAKVNQLPSFKKARLEPEAAVVVPKEEEVEHERSSGGSSSNATGPSSAPLKVPPARPIPGPPASGSSRTSPESGDSSRPSDERTVEEEHRSTSQTAESNGDGFNNANNHHTPNSSTSGPTQSQPRQPAKRGRPRIHPLNNNNNPTPHHSTPDTKSERPKLRRAPGSSTSRKSGTTSKSGTLPNAAVGNGGNSNSNGPPEWMVGALAELRGQYPNDRVEVVPKMIKVVVTPAPGAPPDPGWRLKCLDCPGKVRVFFLG